jgi:hypothetical protein
MAQIEDIDRDTDQDSYEETSGPNYAAWIIPGVAIGAAIGLAYAASHRRRSRWDQTKEVSERLYENRHDFMEGGRNLFDRIQLIVDDGRKVVEEAAGLWSQGRRIVRR